MFNLRDFDLGDVFRERNPGAKRDPPVYGKHFMECSDYVPYLTIHLPFPSQNGQSAKYILPPNTAAYNNVLVTSSAMETKAKAITAFRNITEISANVRSGSSKPKGVIVSC